MPKIIVVVGAGPAGLTAAWELLKDPDFHPIVLEASGEIGGLSRTVVHNGNRMDIGGHRFFSKSDWVMDWWKSHLPIQGSPARDDRDLSRPSSLEPGGPDPEMEDKVFLVRSRLSRILFLRKFFNYPIALSLRTLLQLGPWRIARILGSYLRTRLGRSGPERNLEDFFIHRFGRELYRTFFKDYTEKVWGVPCHSIRPEWGAQRIKGLSIRKALAHAIRQVLPRRRSLSQKTTETSLIERFLYPKLGPGQLWETVAGRVVAAGGEIRFHNRVVRMELDGERISTVVVRTPDGESRIPCDQIVSSMPMRDLVEGLPRIPPAARDVSEHLVYRDYITAGVLLKRLKIRNQTRIPTLNGIIPDNWIYVQEKDARMGRIQFYNNWSPYLVRDPATIWIGLEYFCQEGDELWNLDDGAFLRLACDELETLGIAQGSDILDSTVVRVPKAYPAYFGSYERMGELRAHLDTIPNLWCVGRNGQHRYNNQDHSMLSAREAVRQIMSGIRDPEAVWKVNAEETYHEDKANN
jgi:protoporphyrinogen oxidase